jgi:hypothetical protein
MTSPGNSGDEAGFDQDDGQGGRKHGPPIERDRHEFSSDSSHTVTQGDIHCQQSPVETGTSRFHKPAVAQAFQACERGAKAPRHACENGH